MRACVRACVRVCVLFVCLCLEREGWGRGGVISLKRHKSQLLEEKVELKTGFKPTTKEVKKALDRGSNFFFSPPAAASSQRMDRHTGPHPSPKLSRLAAIATPRCTASAGELDDVEGGGGRL